MPARQLVGAAEHQLLRDPRRLDIQTILCPVDFSDFSFRALTYAASIGRHFCSRIFVQHTIDLPPKSYLGEIEQVATREVLEAELQRASVPPPQKRGSRAADFPEVHLLVNGGDVVAHILESADRYHADLLVMGTHGHKGFNRFILGSVTERVVRQARCPVLVVSRPERGFVDEEEPEKIDLKTILLATDFSPHSDRSLAYALKWASEWPAKLVLFHAVEQTPPEIRGRVDLFPEYNPYFEQELAQAWQTIQTQVPADLAGRCEVYCEVRHGDARQQILQVAAQLRANLIVMGCRGGRYSGPVATWGSTVSAVVRDGRFPVLTVKHLRER
ncbi:MAG: universal stress protein [Acidobacteria bacterium]|nr:universal stress protein [Acidobacteriota bacterium]